MPVASCAATARRAGRVALFAVACVSWVGAAHAELPPGWSVHTFTGRIREIEPAGGFLACATDGGLLFYDPRTNVFAPPIADAGCGDGECLSSNQLTSVSRDASGAYWLGTEASGAVVFRPAGSSRKYGRFFTLNAAPGGGLLADSVRCIEAWSTETVYVGTSRGVGQIDLAGGVDSYNPDAARLLGTHVRGTVVHDLAVDAQFVWVATDSGVSRYDRNPPYAVEFLPTGLGGPETFTIEILAGTVHAGTSVGVFTWQETPHAWQQVAQVGATPFKALSLARLSNGRLFAGSELNMWTWNGFVWSTLNPDPLFLIEARTFHATTATGDSVWTCQQNTSGEGGFLEMWTLGSPWRRFQANSIPAGEVKAVSLSPQGTLWTGMRLSGVASLSNGTWCTYNGNDATVRTNMTDAEGHVSALSAARDGSVWLHALPQPGLNNAVDLLSPGGACNHGADGWDHIGSDEHGFGCRYWKAVEDCEGNTYFLSDGNASPAQSSGGIDAVSANGSQFLNIRDALAADAVGALTFETTAAAPCWQRGFVGLNGLQNTGLYLWQRSNQLFPPQPGPTPSNFFQLGFVDSIEVAEYRDLAVTPGNGNLIWAGTENGVFEYDVAARRVTVLLRAKADGRPGLLSGDIKDLQFDDFGNLWVGSVKGLNRIRLSERQAGRPLTIDAFTTIGIIRELNSQSSAGQIYDPRRAQAPLPAAQVNSLAYDPTNDLLHIGTLGGIATADVQGLSQEAVLPLSGAVLYPNPVRIDAGHEDVRIAHLSGSATVAIYTLEGELVCEVTDREDGDVVWTLGTPSCLEGEGNFRVASGAYMVRISTSAGSTMRTLVVIR